MKLATGKSTNMTTQNPCETPTKQTKFSLKNKQPLCESTPTCKTTNTPKLACTQKAGVARNLFKES